MLFIAVYWGEKVFSQTEVANFILSHFKPESDYHGITSQDVFAHFSFELAMDRHRKVGRETGGMTHSTDRHSWESIQQWLNWAVLT